MSEFAEHLADLFAEFGEVQVRRMFGAHGLFHDGLMFGIVADDTLYLKVDPGHVEPFESRGRRVTLSYYQAPAEVLDDPAQAARWARRAHDAALRAKAARPRRSRS